MSRIPRVSIGLPVYNGDRYLRDAIDSIVCQTFTDFELIISDNGSTDQTEAICQSYIDKDSRIRYYRSENNRGAAWNYNRVFQLSSGEYFKWAAHDDICAPEFLAKCVAMLDCEQTVVLCYTIILDIDEQGRHLSRLSRRKAESDKPHERFRNLILRDYTCEETFGIIRSNILRKTPLIGNYSDSDRVLLSELSLYGRFYEVPEGLFFHRIHEGMSTKQHDTRHKRMGWFDPVLADRVVFPYVRQFIEYVFVIRRSRLPRRERLLCYGEMSAWLREHRRQLQGDIKHGLKQSAKSYVPGSSTVWHWFRRLRRHGWKP